MLIIDLKARIIAIACLTVVALWSAALAQEEMPRFNERTYHDLGGSPNSTIPPARE